MVMQGLGSDYILGLPLNLACVFEEDFGNATLLQNEWRIRTRQRSLMGQLTG